MQMSADNNTNMLNLNNYDSNPLYDKKQSQPMTGISLPDLSNVDVSAMPMLAQQKQSMSFAGELTNRCGISYFSGLIASGFYGAFRGWRLSQSGIPLRLRFNSLLNHAMKLGAHNG
eukprot:116474_1